MGFRRSRGPLVPTIAILVALAVLVSIAAGIWTDVLWFSSIGFTKVYTTELVTKVLLFTVGFILTAALVASSLVIGYRARPVYAPVTPQQQNLDQYREAIEPLRRVATIGIPVVLGFLAGTGAAGQWKTFLLWRNSVSFGQKDPQFGIDLSFFVFTLPWLRFVLGFVTMMLIMALIAAAFTHYVYGGVQLQGRGERTTHAARTHLAVLLAALVLVRAGSYWVDRYSLLTKDSPLLTGIKYTDAHAVMPTKAILAVASIMTAALFIASIWTRSWRLPIIGVALLTVTAVVVGGIYPALIQNFTVKPSEKQKEAKYLDRSIKATRAAYGLDGVQVDDYKAATTATRNQLRDDTDTIPGIRLVDPNVVSPTFKQLQSVKSYYAFPDSLDVDRYRLDGKENDTVIAVRELDLDGVPANQRNWINDHTVYTHGFGVVAAYGNRRGDDGQPVFYEKDIPPTGTLGNFEPRIYFGEKSPAYSIVGAPKGSRPLEFDYPDNSAAGQKNNTYQGNGGVAIGSFMRRAAYAIKYRELKFLLSNAVNDNSRLLYNRQPLERVRKVAPWLTLDGNPYPAVVGGRVQWIVDGYTTSADYPYSRLQDIDNATSDSVTETSSAVRAISTGQINYIRNSVKATVDAFDGSVKLYTWDDKDPVLKAWSKAFSGTVRPMSEISGDLMSHLRYPEDLFKVQRMMLARYHVTDADSFYGGQDFWRVPNDPTEENAAVYQPPYYLTLAMPKQSSPSFSLTTTFQPTGDREVLSGFLAVDANAGSENGKRRDGYGKLRLLELPRDSTVKGPGQVANDINSSNVSSEAYALTLNQFLNQSRQSGSRVTMGNLLTLPVGGGLLYVQPIYVQANGPSSYPLSRATVVAFGDKLAWSDTLTGALDGLFGGQSGAQAGDKGTGSGPTTTTKPPTGSNATALDQALKDIQSAYDDGRQALKDGDFAAYGEAQKRLNDAIQRAVSAAPQGSVTVTPTPSPSGSATATPSPTTSK
ncbi:hypothetical protein SAMN05216199_1113 [Pedococcus cremeus]|uniref:UPF0182 protein SAMN05216199_1113 n=1 Tax=Pedococcus cremeus TaxID=587636 RepID=A0A1H9RT62_9MICO|nr:UPF0182 family protein [Pedococcus cremeus]SER75982.1 hypothetical protein SAMN05216199_1113 [Pedococcus cremeus]